MKKSMLLTSLIWYTYCSSLYYSNRSMLSEKKDISEKWSLCRKDAYWVIMRRYQMLFTSVWKNSVSAVFPFSGESICEYFNLFHARIFTQNVFLFAWLFRLKTFYTIMLSYAKSAENWYQNQFDQHYQVSQNVNHLCLLFLSHKSAS